MPPLFDKNQQLYESELLDSLDNKYPRSHKAMLILQDFNPETGDMETFIKHCKWAQNRVNIAMAKVSASDKDSDTKRQKKRSKFKECEDNGKKYRKKTPSLYCSLHAENKTHASRECKVLKKRAKDKDNPKYGKMNHKKIFKGLNLLQAKTAHQKSKYENLNKSFPKKNTSKEDTVILDDNLDSNSSSIREAENLPDEDEKP